MHARRSLKEEIYGLSSPRLLAIRSAMGTEAVREGGYKPEADSLAAVPESRQERLVERQASSWRSRLSRPSQKPRGRPGRKTAGTASSPKLPTPLNAGRPSCFWCSRLAEVTRTSLRISGRSSEASKRKRAGRRVGRRTWVVRGRVWMTVARGRPEEAEHPPVVSSQSISSQGIYFLEGIADGYPFPPSLLARVLDRDFPWREFVPGSSACQQCFWRCRRAPFLLVSPVTGLPRETGLGRGQGRIVLAKSLVRSVLGHEM